ncbi:MAG: ion channel [Pseudomonadota bacterium]
MLLGLALLIEAMIWASAFIDPGVTDAFWQAFYCAIVMLTTLGYGDLTPHGGAQPVAAFCAVAGLFLVALSTAFVVEILRLTPSGTHD